MRKLSIIGFSGSASRPSRTRSLIETVVRRAAVNLNATAEVFDLGDVLPTLATTLDGRGAQGEVRRLLLAIAEADALVVGSPIYKGSYTGLFKHVFDLIEPKALRDKPVVLTATGGSERHALALEHGLRPLFAFFSADIIPTALYATEGEFADYQVAGASLIARVERAADELTRRLDSTASAATDRRIAAVA